MFKEFAENKNAKLPSSQYRGWAIWRTGTILLGAYHTEAIINSLKYPYSNGKLEGKNNLIKVIKRIAFGFRTFRHLRMRVLIQQNICEII